MRLRLLEHNASERLLDLDALSGLTEICLEEEEGFGVKSIAKFGVSMGPLLNKVALPSQIVTVVPRYVVFNDSEDSIIVRQCHLQVCSQYSTNGCSFFSSSHMVFIFVTYF